MKTQNPSTSLGEGRDVAPSLAHPSQKQYLVVYTEDLTHLHQSERIHDDPRVFDSAALKTVDDHAPNLHGPSRSGHAKKLPSVRTGPLEAGHHLVALGNLLFDREVQVGKSSPHTAQNIFQPFQAWALAGKRNLLYYILQANCTAESI